MRKNLLIALLVILVVAAGAVYAGFRILNRGRDIIGVTTLEKENTVIMNSATGDEFVGGTGKITVKEDEHLHLEYKLKEGSFDLTADQGGTPVEQKGIEGEGSLDLEAEPGNYTVTFTMNGAIGNAVLTAKK